jgi:membrane protease YdiL (CAAX protease family)
MKWFQNSSVVRGKNWNWFVSLTTLVVSGLLVAGLWCFNRPWNYYDSFLVGNAVGLFFLPMLVIILLGEEPSSFGFGMGDSRSVRLVTVLLYAGLLVILIPMSHVVEFQGAYPIFKQFHYYPITDNLGRVFGYSRFVEGNTSGLIYGWISYGMYMFFWEFFFRGFLLFGLARTAKWPAIILQAAAFSILHIGKPIPEVIAAFPAGIILGMLALRARSFIPGFFLHWAAFVSFDVLVILSRH